MVHCSTFVIGRALNATLRRRRCNFNTGQIGLIVWTIRELLQSGQGLDARACICFSWSCSTMFNDLPVSHQYIHSHTAGRPRRITKNLTRAIGSVNNPCH